MQAKVPRNFRFFRICLFPTWSKYTRFRCINNPRNAIACALDGRHPLPKEAGRITSRVATENPTHAQWLFVPGCRGYLAMKTDTSRRANKEVEPYAQLQQQMHEALRRQHPEWVHPNGASPMCDAYESRLAELLGVPFPSEQRVAA